MMNRSGPLGAGVALCMLASGCGGLIPGAAGPVPAMYDLDPAITLLEGLPRQARQLVIEEPVAARGLDTDRIALRPGALTVDYYAESRWSDRAPRMVQTLLVQAFDDSDRITAVGRQGAGLRPDYTLKSELRAFQAELGGAAPVVRVEVVAKLVRGPEARIFTAATFVHRVQAGDPSLDGVVTAFDSATGRVVSDLTAWTLQSLGGDRADPRSD